MTSFGHSKPCQKTVYIYASLSLIISLIKLMSVNYTYNNKKNLTWIFMKGTGCYSNTFPSLFAINLEMILLQKFIKLIGRKSLNEEGFSVFGIGTNKVLVHDLGSSCPTK